jgi:hypothetical protein
MINFSGDYSKAPVRGDKIEAFDDPTSYARRGSCILAYFVIGRSCIL